MMVPENTPHYVELVTSEPDRVRAICEKTHGWRFEQMGPELGGSWVAELTSGGRVGIRAPMHELEKPIVRVYTRVTDLDRAVAVAEENGAMIALSSMSVGKHGRIAIYIVAGIEQGLWELAAAG